MDYLVTYDISDPKRLRKIEKAVKSFAVRVQKSVFECVLKESQLEKMIEIVEKIMDKNEDSIRIYPLLANSRQKQKILGYGDIPAFTDAVVI